MEGPSSPSIEIGIVESNDQSRQFIAAVIGGTPGFHLACVCSAGREALWSFAQKVPDLVMVSLFLRDMTGTDLIQRSRALWPELVPILLIPEHHPHLLTEVLEAGASAYLPTPCGAEDLIRAIWTVRAGGAVISSPVAKVIVEYFRARGLVFRLLTDRERQILKCMSRGLSQEAMAIELRINKATVRTHVKNILGKLEVHSSAEAIALYLNPKAVGPRAEIPTSAYHPRILASGMELDGLALRTLKLPKH